MYRTNYVVMICPQGLMIIILTYIINLTSCTVLICLTSMILEWQQYILYG